MSGETKMDSPVNLQHRNDSMTSPISSNQRQHSSRVHSTHARPNTNTTGSNRISSSGERHTLPEIPRNPLTATVAHVVSRELGENFLKAPMRPETVKKLVVSGNVDDVSHRIYVQHLREIQAKREYQLQKIGNDEQTFLLADIQARENADEGSDEKILLSSLYVDEENLTKDQVILPRDFLSFNLQRNIKTIVKEEKTLSEGEDIPTVEIQEIQEKDRLPKLVKVPMQRTSKTLWKEEMTVPDRDATRARLQQTDNMVHFPVNPRFDSGRQNQLITTIKPPAILPVFEAIPSEVVFTRYRVGDVHETTLQLRNLSSVAHSCRVIPPRTPYFCISLSQYPSGHSFVASGLSILYNIKFAPDTLGVYQDEIIVQCSNGTEFAVKLLAKRPPPLLTLPPTVDCGYWLAGGRKMCEFTVRNDGGEGRFAIVAASLWPAVNFKTVARSETVVIPPFELAPATVELRPGDVFPLQLIFTPQTAGEFLEEFVMICDNGETARFKLKGVAQTIQVRFEEIEGGVVDLNTLESRDISAQYSTNFITINPFSYCQKKMTVKNLTNVELPFFWATLEPVIYTRDDFAKQTQPIEIERVVSESSPFHIEPNRGAFPPLATIEFRLIFAPSQIGNFHSVFHLIVPNAPVHQPISPTPNLSSIGSASAGDRNHSAENMPRSVNKATNAASAALRTTDYTVLRFETRGICENFKYILDPFAMIFMDKLHKNLAYRKDFQLTNTSISPLIITWLNLVGDDIVNIEPVMAEIPSDSTAQFTLIFTGMKIGQSKIEVPFKIEGIDDYGYFHVEAEVIGPDVDIEPATLDFGLIEFGETVERMIDIKNLSPIVAKCQLEQIDQDHTDSILFVPSGREITLKPIEVYRIPISLSAKEEGLYRSHLQLIVEDGKIIPVEITAIIQRPSAYLSSAEIDLGQSFVNVPIVRQIELNSVNELPTYFQWGEPISDDPNQCSVLIEPSSGILNTDKPFPIKLTFVAQCCGPLSDDFHIPCYIQNASQPIFLNLKSNMCGMNVEFRIDDRVYSFDEKFQLDFERVAVGEKSRIELIINNLTDINSDVTANVLNFKTRSIAPGHGQKATHFEPANQEIGVGFHLDRAETDSYPLDARGTAVIPLTVVSSMWGKYRDLLRIRIKGINEILEIPIQVEIIGNPIKTYLSVNPNSRISSFPIVQFGSMLHNGPETVKKVHMQNVSHVPIRIDWIVYDLEEDTSERPQLIELIPVVDNNPFDTFESEIVIADASDDLASENSASSKSDFQSESAGSSRASTASNPRKKTPLVRLFVKPYRGQRASATTPIFSATSTQKIIKPREHFYLDIKIEPKNCSLKNRPVKCNARIVGILSVSEERQGCDGKGFYRPVYYEHNEQIEFEVHSSLEMPSLRFEIDDDDCDHEQTDGLSFAVPIGDILSCRSNIFDCAFPMPKSGRSSAKSSSQSSSSRGMIYSRNFHLLNTRQSTIPFDLSLTDKSFLSIEPSTTKSLIPQEKCRVECQFHLTQSLIDRFHPNNDLPENVEETRSNEHGRRIRWKENVIVRFEKTQTEQIIPIDIRLYFPILSINLNRIDFGTCFLEQTRQREFILKNVSCSTSSWSIRKVNGNMPEAYEAFRIEPKSGVLHAKMNSKEKIVQQVISVYFTARHNQTYQCQLMIEGLLGEPPLEITLTGEGSYDGKYEAVLDI